MPILTAHFGHRSVRFSLASAGPHVPFSLEFDPESGQAELRESKAAAVKGAAGDADDGSDTARSSLTDTLAHGPQFTSHGALGLNDEGNLKPEFTSHGALGVNDEGN
jgi:hypothetical protein